MSESAIEMAPRRRRYLYIAAAGATIILLDFLLAILVIADKKQFSWLVTWQFLPATTIAALLGSIAMLIAVFNLSERSTWGGRGVILWALIGLLSPLLGIMFLTAWGLMFVTSPLVIWALLRWFKRV